MPGHGGVRSALAAVVVGGIEALPSSPAIAPPGTSVMYTPDDRKPMTVPALAEARRGGHKLAMLTAYDAGFARVFDDNGVDLLLVGDSVGMVGPGRSEEPW